MPPAARPPGECRPVRREPLEDTNDVAHRISGALSGFRVRTLHSLASAGGQSGRGRAERRVARAMWRGGGGIGTGAPRGRRSEWRRRERISPASRTHSAIAAGAARAAMGHIPCDMWRTRAEARWPARDAGGGRIGAHERASTRGARLTTSSIRSSRSSRTVQLSRRAASVASGGIYRRASGAARLVTARACQATRHVAERALATAQRRVALVAPGACRLRRRAGTERRRTHAVSRAVRTELSPTAAAIARGAAVGYRGERGGDGDAGQQGGAARAHSDQRHRSADRTALAPARHDAQRAGAGAGSKGFNCDSHHERRAHQHLRGQSAACRGRLPSGGHHAPRVCQPGAGAWRLCAGVRLARATSAALSCLRPRAV